MAEVACPRCSGTEWKAVEQITQIVPVELSAENNHVVIEPDPMSEFVRENVTSIVTDYFCANPECRYCLSPDNLYSLLPKA